MDGFRSERKATGWQGNKAEKLTQAILTDKESLEKLADKLRATSIFNPNTYQKYSVREQLQA